MSFGPLRLNASRSGLGVSLGVPGARVGVGPRGSYVQVGRGGIYYRQTIRGPGGRAGASAGAPAAGPWGTRPQPVPLAPAMAGISAFQSREGSSVAALAGASSSDILEELNRVQQRWPLVPVALIGGLAVLMLVLRADTPGWLPGVLLGLTAAATLVAWRVDAREGRTVLQYELDAVAEQDYAALRRGLEALEQCHLVRHTSAAAHVYDQKRNAGAGQILQSKDVRPSRGAPRRVVANLAVPVLPAGSRTFYFYPDRVLVYEGSAVVAVPYDEITTQSGTTQFIESERLPPDAQVVGTTWQYVNKGGGPDRRFNNNRQLPIALYGTLTLASRSGLRAEFMCSRPDAARLAAAALSQASRTTLRVQSAPLISGA